MEKWGWAGIVFAMGKMRAQKPGGASEDEVRQRLCG